MEKKMKAVVLAAGEGQRLRPLTLTRPKHMIKIAGKPLLEHLFDSLKAAGVKDILVVVHYKAEQIKKHFGDGSSRGLKISYVYQKGVKGTANAFGLAEKYVNEDFMAVNGDLLVTTDVVKAVLKIHKQEKPAVTMTVIRVENPERYGNVTLEGIKVVSIVEKPSPKAAADNPVNAGVYVFSPEIFDVIRRTQDSRRGEQEVTDSIKMLIQDNRKVIAAKISGEKWLDIGRPWDLLEANTRLLKTMKTEVLGAVESGAHLADSAFVAEGATVLSGAYIEGPSYIGEGSIIGPNCYIRPYTSIGRNVRVGNACEVKNSILMDNVHMGHLSYVGDSIIGEGCNLGAGTITANLRFDDKPVKMMVKDELVDTGRKKVGVVIGDNAKTGIGVRLMPGVKIGCNSWIGPSYVVRRDVPSDVRLLGVTE
jgi:bifunctional UDP-N-acetylglucosamine pyrophosphorylase/glucosamine-1-phosphate N-acetyltransferase